MANFFSCMKKIVDQIGAFVQFVLEKIHIGLLLAEVCTKYDLMVSSITNIAKFIFFEKVHIGLLLDRVGTEYDFVISNIIALPNFFSLRDVQALFLIKSFICPCIPFKLPNINMFNILPIFLLSILVQSQMLVIIHQPLLAIFLYIVMVKIMYEEEGVVEYEDVVSFFVSFAELQVTRLLLLLPIQ